MGISGFDDHDYRHLYRHARRWAGGKMPTRRGLRKCRRRRCFGISRDAKFLPSILAQQKPDTTATCVGQGGDSILAYAEDTT